MYNEPANARLQDAGKKNVCFEKKAKYSDNNTRPEPRERKRKVA